MADTELTDLSIVEMDRMLNAGAVSPVELTTACLDRIRAVDPSLNAVLRLLPDRAMAAARTAEAEIAAGRRSGPLHGVPYALKDIIDLAGVPTTGHSAIFQNASPAAASAPAARRLEDAGAICLAKLSTWEFAVGGPSFDLPWPPARNPWDRERTPGGSSSGSGAGLAARFFPAALGTDTGGSVRNPAASCGVVGLKPTYGRVPLKGVMPLSTTLDHVGPMTRTVADNAILFQTIAGHDSDDATTAAAPVPDLTPALAAGVKGMKIGVIRHFWERDAEAAPEIVAAMEEALAELRRLGAETVDVVLAPLRDYVKCLSGIMAAEAYAWHRPHIEARPDAYGALAAKRIAPGATQLAIDYLAALETRKRLAAEYVDAMAEVEAVVTIVALAPPPRFDDTAGLASSYTLEGRPPFNIARAPAMALPIGATATGLPIAMQIVARPFEEAAVYRVAAAYERATDWTSRKPVL